MSISILDIPVGIGDWIIAILIGSLFAYKILPFIAFIGILLVFISAWSYFQYRAKQHWHQLGVPGPKVNIFFGATLNQFRRGVVDIDREMFEKYGNSYGSYMFGRREFCTKDPEMIRRVFIKDFPYFQNRMTFLSNPKKAPKNVFTSSISNLQDDDWKRVRNRVTPAFTTGKLKKLIPILCGSTDRLCNMIEQKFVSSKKELILKDLFGRLVLDEIGHAGFSLDLNTFEDEQNDFVKHTKALFNSKGFRNRIMIIVACPFISHFYQYFTGQDPFSSTAAQFFETMMKQLYEKRRADPDAKEKYADVFQLLLNAVEEEQENTVNDIASTTTVPAEDADIVHKELAVGNYGKHLTPIELFAQGFLLFVAGYDTTGSTLAYAAYSLAVHAEIQEKLREEIVGVLGEDEIMTYEHLRQMRYLQAVLQETSRMYPVAPKLNRECSADCVINGIPLQKGDIVTLPIYNIQHDDNYYSEPEKFDPERFMPDPRASRDPFTFLTFGLGPRNCIGMRLAEFQMHIAIALIIRRFRLIPGPNTPKFPLKLSSADFLRPTEPLVVLAEKM